MLAKRFKWTISPLVLIVVVAVIVGIICGGLNLGIDFTGGSLITVDIGGDFDEDTVRDAARAVDGIQGDVSVVKTGDALTQALIRIQSSGDETATSILVDKMVENLKGIYPGATLGSIESVGGIASGDLIRNAIFAVLLASVLMLIYIWIRFDLYSGIGAFLALLHDVIIMISVMCIFQVQVDSNFIAACLTIVGYSINDTVIVFDRIRENNAHMNPREFTKDQVASVSIRQTVGRTINTSITTLIMIACLYIFGVQTIKIFTFPLLIGVIAGTYSSLFVAGSVWVLLYNKFGANKKRRGVKPIR